MTLEHVVPWGRNLQEYQQMFLLTHNDLKRSVLGCSDGPSSFNKEATDLGSKVTSIDPVYEFSQAQIKQRVDETAEVILDQVAQTKDDFVWDTITSIKELETIRMSAMKDFLNDYVQGKEENRYITGSLPDLPFKAKQFDLVLCSHFLFLYSEHFDQKFHTDAVLELCRVGKEVRIFPIIDLQGNRSAHLDSLLAKLEEENYRYSIETTPYEFQKGGNEMLKVLCD